MTTVPINTIKIPDLDGIDTRVENGAILDASEIKLLTRIIRKQAASQGRPKPASNWVKVATVEAEGVPRPAGSKTPGQAKSGKLYVRDSSGVKGKAWREAVAIAGKLAFYNIAPLTGPVAVRVRFGMPRPKNHFRTGKYSHIRKDTAPEFHLKVPDATKLWRSAEDSLKGIAWLDDSQVVRQEITKEFNDRPGVSITIYRWEG